MDFSLVFSAVLEFCLYVLVAMFVQNAVLGRALGVSRLVKLVNDGEMDSLTFCLLLCAVQLIAAPLAYVANDIWLVSSDYSEFIRPLVFAICTIIAFIFTLIIVASLFPTRISKPMLSVLSMATINSCIAGTLLITTIQGFTFVDTLGFALGSGLGYTAVVFILLEGENRMNSDMIPKALRGLPINLLYLAILSIAVYGMTGHMLSF